MKARLKHFFKKYIPSSIIELIAPNSISITKIPPKGAVISDLFILRIENGWKTYFECLQYETLLNPKEKVESHTLVFCFYTKGGQRLTEREVTLSLGIKSTINVNQLISDFPLNEDGLFAIFHQLKKNWINQYNSFLAERGYIGYANPKLGSIKGFVHGNLDAIARSTLKSKDKLLGNYSFFKKEYRLQHSFEPGNTYELYLVNPTSTEQKFTIIHQSNLDVAKTTVVTPPKGLYKHVKSVDKKEGITNIIIESKLYLARPVVFKIMPSSFDVFHG